MEPQMEMPEQEGRGGDTVMAHLSLGELVIPRAFLDDPEVMQVMKVLFDEAGANINQYIVGDPANSINPETGYPEFGFFKSLKKIFKVAAPLALSYFAPGIGTALGATAGSAGASALGGAVAGGAGGLLSGKGLKGALTGAALGGAGGYIAGGGINDTAFGRGVNSISNSIGAGNVFGAGTGTDFANTSLGRGVNSFTNDIGIGNVLGDTPSFNKIISTPITSGIPGSSASQGAIQGAGTGASTSAYGGSSIGNILGGLSSVGARDDAAEKLLEQQRLAQQQYAPFLNQTFDAGDFKADPGYQFRQQEGEQALARRQAASGGLFSGNALKEASAFNQGNADQAYNDAYNRWLSTQRQGVGAAQAVNGIYDNVGNIQAGNTLANSNTFNNTLSNILGGGNVAGEDIDPLTGKPRKKVTA